jgi:pimeloyl-ACP methyl ester carboxylesterase
LSIDRINKAYHTHSTHVGQPRRRRRPRGRPATEDVAGVSGRIAAPPSVMQPVTLRSGCGVAGRRILRGEMLPPRPAAATTSGARLCFVWVHGLGSVSASTKSDALLGLARRLGAGMLRLDMTGHGESAARSRPQRAVGDAAEGMDDVTLTAWVEDIAAAVGWVGSSSWAAPGHRAARGGEREATVAPPRLGLGLGGAPACGGAPPVAAPPLAPAPASAPASASASASAAAAAAAAAAATPVRVVLVGYSFGALAAAHFAAHR